MSSADATRNVLAFDIYGTILNTNSVGVTLQSLLSISEDQANAVCLLWRRYQLEYTWRLNSMGVYEPFDVVTSNALQHALSEHGHPHDEQLTAQIMASYNHLKPFDDAAPTLNALQDLPNVDVVIFSNGTEDMVTTALAAASLAPAAQRTYLVGAAQAYKPARAVYAGLLRHVRAADAPQRVWLVSGNPFDVVGARAAGMRAVWVDRAGGGWVDRASALRPSAVVRGLEEVVGLMRQQ